MAFKTTEMPRPETRAPERMNSFDRLTFFSYVAQMLLAGIPLARAVSGLVDQYTEPSTRRVLEALAEDLYSGSSLSRAMRRFPRSFSALHVGVVAAGENGGRLPGSLSRLAQHDERWLSLTRQVKSMLIYPLVVFCAALLLVVGLAQVLVSGVAPVLAEARVKLNPLSALVFWGAGLLRNPLAWCVTVVVLIASAYALGRWVSTPVGRLAWERVSLRLPLLGPLIRKIEVTRICESLATLYECGMPLTSALAFAAETCDTSAARDAMVRVEAEVSNGVSLSAAFATSGFVHRATVQMVAVAEATGALAPMLRKVAFYQDLDVRSALEQFSAAIEPIMIASLGVVVAVIIVVAFAPLYQLMASMA